MNRRRPPTTAIRPAVLTLSEACEYLRVGESWLRQHKREIGHVGTGRLLRFELAALDAWIAKRRVSPPSVALVPQPRKRKPTRLAHRREGLNPVTQQPWESEAAR